MAIYEDIPLPEVPADPLKFRDEKRYVDRLRDARTKTGAPDAVKIGHGVAEGLPLTIGVQDFDFMGGSLGMAAGEAVIKGLTIAVERRTPFVMFAASGGARMQEGMFSLMQMPRTTVAVQRLRAARLPYVVVLTNPTTGGVTASYAMLGDVHIAEPGASSASPDRASSSRPSARSCPMASSARSICATHGMVDMVVHRHEMKSTVVRLCRLLTERHQSAPVVSPEPAPQPDSEAA